jgi:hypothetical protein
MSKVEERLQILTMVQNGTITAAEGAKLLAALDEAPVRETAGDDRSPARWFRVRVTDLATGRSKVNVNIPIGLVNVGMRMGARFAPEMSGINMNEVISSIKSGTRGKLIDVEDVEDGEHVEIYVE